MFGNQGISFFNINIFCEMKKKLFVVFLLLTTICCSYAQQKDFSYWDKLLKTEKNFKKFIYYSKISMQRSANNYYGNDFQLIEGMDKNCAKDKFTFINCLNKAGFKKSKEYADITFSLQDAMLAFRKANPDFVKLPLQTQQKLMVKYIR